AFYVMQELNKPLLLIVRCSPLNVRSGRQAELKVTLVNEDQLQGRMRLTLRMTSPSGREVFAKDRMVEVQPWVSVIFQQSVTLEGESGRYPMEAILWDGSRPVVKKQDYCTMFHSSDLAWPSRPVSLFDPGKTLEPFLRERGARFSDF